MFCNTCIRIVLLLFMYDWSSGRTKYPSGALNVNVMQVNFGGKQERLAKLNPTTIVQDYVYPDNFPENLPRLKKGDVQHMIFQENDPPPFYRPNLSKEQYVGQPKGMKQVLYEWGCLWMG